MFLPFLLVSTFVCVAFARLTFSFFLFCRLIILGPAAFSRRLLDMRDTTALLSPLEDEELPHLWQKPAYDVLFASLRRLHVEPRVWTAHVSRADVLKEQAATAHARREVVSFLSTVIKSSLAWLGSDDEREVIWEEASKRMSERCGRTGMPATEPKRAESEGVEDDG